MNLFHMNDRVEIAWEEGDYTLHGIENKFSNRRGHIVRVSNAVEGVWLRHRVKLLSGLELSVPQDKLTLRDEE